MSTMMQISTNVLQMSSLPKLNIMINKIQQFKTSYEPETEGELTLWLVQLQL